MKIHVMWRLNFLEKRLNSYSKYLFGALLALVSCRGPQFSVNNIQPELLLLDSSFKETDPLTDRLIFAYKNRLDSMMTEPLGNSPVSMGKQRPEGLLGNWCADAIQYQALKYAKDTPVFTLLNHGGLRSDIPAGTITLGKIYEVMPFDNELVLILMPANLVDTLIQSIILSGGDPISGIRITACENHVEFETESPKADYYWVATSDYLANGGDSYRILEKGIYRFKTGLLIRDALVEYIRYKPTLESKISGRIKICP